MDNSGKIILDLCGGTGAWSKPYKEAGYDVRVITLPDFNVLNFTPPKNVYGILAAPPCTMFSIARNDTTAKKPRDFTEGLEVVSACLRIIWQVRCQTLRKSAGGLKFWALENPRGYLTDFLGKPALEFDPCDYGDPYTKRTCIWGNFSEPKQNRVKPDRGTMVTHAAHFQDLKPVEVEYQRKLGVDSRTIRRSITPQGFAQAFYEANK
jgi:hypothetical protein